MKKIVFILMIGLFAANTVSAQAKKLGHINSQELVNLMPEAKAAQDKYIQASFHCQRYIDY